jgi:predicted small lipoprotein YifL
MRFTIRSAIVTAFALTALAGCGNRGALYMPRVPPLPAPPHTGSAGSGGMGDAAQDSNTGDAASPTSNTPGRRSATSAPAR